MSNSQRRVFLGGLFKGATEADLHSRFRSFGKISGVELRTKRDDDGEVFKTFAYMNIFGSEADFNKCIKVYSGTTWKGSTLAIQKARQNFLDKLKDEQKEAAENAGKVKIESSKKTMASSYAKHLLTGTTLNYDQWVVTKDKKMLPIVNIRQKDNKKVVKIDPTANPHQVKKLRVEPRRKAANKLTWEIAEKPAKHQPRAAIKPVSKPAASTCNVDSDSSDSSNEEARRTTSTTTTLNTDIAQISSPFKQASSAKESDFEIVAVDNNSRADDKLRLRTKYDSSSDEDFQIAAETKSKHDTNKNKRKRLTKTKRAVKQTPQQAGDSSSNSSEDFYATLDAIAKHDDISSKSRDVTETLSLGTGSKSGAAATQSDSESDVPDVGLWTSSSKTVTDTSKRDTAVSSAVKKSPVKVKVVRDKKTKQEAIKTEAEPSKKQVKVTPQSVLRDEFISGLVDSSKAVVDECVMNVSRGGDRDCDSDEDDLLDVIKANKWKEVKEYETQARQSLAGNNQGKTSKSRDNRKRATADDSSALKKQIVKQKLSKNEEDDDVSRTLSAVTTEQTRTDTTSAEQTKAEESRTEQTKAEQARVAKYKSSTERHRADNEKRLESLREKNKQSLKQSSMIKAALASVDSVKSSSNKIVFESSDDEQQVTAAAPVSSSRVSKGSKQKQQSDGVEQEKASLFADNEEESEDETYDFSIKKQFQGKQGGRLQALQNRIGSVDKRFTIDERFADVKEGESSSDDETPGEKLSEGEREKRKSLGILQDMVGSTHSTNKDRKKREFKDMSMLHYDPTRADHKQFERVEEPDTAPDRKKKRKKGDVAESRDVTQPEVGKEKYFEVSSELQDAFKDKAVVQKQTTGEGQFSLLSMFGDTESQQKDNSKATSESRDVKNESISSLWQRGDSSSDDEGAAADLSTVKLQSDDSGISDSEETTEEKSVLFKGSVNTFFISEGDPRLAEGAQFFRADKEAAEKRWHEKRAQLSESYRTIRKRMQRKAKSGGSYSDKDSKGYNNNKFNRSNTFPQRHGANKNFTSFKNRKT